MTAKRRRTVPPPFDELAEGGLLVRGEHRDIESLLTVLGPAGYEEGDPEGRPIIVGWWRKSFPDAEMRESGCTWQILEARGPGPGAFRATLVDGW